MHWVFFSLTHYLNTGKSLHSNIWTCFCNRWCVYDVSVSMCLYFLITVTNSPSFLNNLTSSTNSFAKHICRYSSHNVCYVSESASQSTLTGNVLLPVSRDASGTGLYMHSKGGKVHLNYQSITKKMS